MYRHGLLLATVLTLVLTGWMLTRVGWHGLFKAAPVRSLPTLKIHAPFASEAAWNWRCGGPRHWRMCLLQH
jgi:hypothetical protein